ncbi:hypothetical protein [Levilactobacillus wangkuiensis]|uniref:hypothetical protein n=1 Tax=Levilactobacillus wangkuiensis TaxID=2799566 RepID=UPI0019423DB7|nr:hypothetical protein [Levilactobacillus wangkuiensis]
MKEWIKGIWHSWIGKTASIVAISSLGFTAFGQISNAFQHHQQVKGAKAMMIASCRDSIYDCDRLLMKYRMLENVSSLPASQFKYNLMSLKDNEDTLQHTSLSVLGDNDLQNFQTYNKDLNVTIAQIENSFSILKKDSGKYYDKEGPALTANEPFYHVSKSQAQIAVDNLVTLRDNFKYDLKVIHGGGLIVDNELYDKNFEKVNHSWLQKSRDRYGNFVKNYKEE